MFQKILVANRGEIAIRAFRAAYELGARTVAVFPYEDRDSLHRQKADEAYQIGEPGHPVRAYLDVAEILRVAKEAGADAIYPGYGFLSENPDLAEACEANGITFIGPPARVLRSAGNKVTAKEQAIAAGVPVLRSSRPSRDVAELLAAADEIGFPIFAKAVAGGGGRGMRRVERREDLEAALTAAMREADSAFGDPTMFLEQAVLRPRHIEVQILADAAGTTLHLFERDCSVQRRHQKVVEIAPAPNLPEETRQALYRDAIAFAESIGYVNAGTVEFLLDTAGERAGEHVFIEMNPRIQVEHTVTEEITDVDLVQSQMRIAAGETMADLGLRQQDLVIRGAALQCRITTEDPNQNFRPDTGRITTYRSPGGAGVRLDGGTINPGAQHQPALRLDAREAHLPRARLRHRRRPREARAGRVPDPRGRDEHPVPAGRARRPRRSSPGTSRPRSSRSGRSSSGRTPRGTAARRSSTGSRTSRSTSRTARGPPVRSPPTSCRPSTSPPRRPPAPGSACSSSARRAGRRRSASRPRSRSPRRPSATRTSRCSPPGCGPRTSPPCCRTSRGSPRSCSRVEAWGGATYDVALRFLGEDPWERLATFREALPNVAIQMLLRGRNTVGYTPYPTEVTDAFVAEAAATGVDVFRIFDALNDVEQMRPAIDAVLATGTAVAEAGVCYTGDLLDPAEDLYTLDYYLRLAERMVAAGAHVLAVKDMAGLLRPRAAAKLVEAFRREFELPVHVHTHDTAGGQLATLLAASDAGADAVDVAAAPMAGTTSQPSFSALVAALAHTERDTGHPALGGVGPRAVLGSGPSPLQAVRVRPARAHRPRVPPRDPRRPAVEPPPAGDRARPRRPLRAHRGPLRRLEPHPRPHPQGDAVVEGRRRPRAAARGDRGRPARLRAAPGALRHPRLRRRLHGGRARRPAGRLAGAVPHQGARRPHREDRASPRSATPTARPSPATPPPAGPP